MTLAELKTKALQNTRVKEAYDELETEFNTIDNKLINSMAEQKIYLDDTNKSKD
ncbi:TPA: hypothetical protein I9781_003053 [Legionella pneumophila]|uniref:hypothetical protein n=1 Tax=Legionella pneumophila TaxID=446 RepID=UPI000A741ED3|nr:hypothetical protein [Legionella pneumophila]HAT3858315.1 hypothetical protein [Legionella pneumophila]HAT3867735.1 hypothetical protein [Legionella pneumophila]HAT3877501.1 hypothetical protein [Legionella pneumophila]HAT3973428.1 hypothetical protein [Legionella pneumophila]HAT3989601.1 hypothetical protein [Legionella pneumophila]